MNNNFNKVVIVAYGRSAIAKAKKGALKNVHPVDFAGQILAGVLDRVPKLNKNQIDDVIIGCARPQEIQGSNISRLISLRAGLPATVPAQTVSRLCSSGLQAIVTGANEIIAGQSDIVVAGGVEYLTKINTGTPDEYKCSELEEICDSIYMPMGLTAEEVAKEYKVTRDEMDRFALESHRKAAKAIIEKKFTKEIIPIKIKDDNNDDYLFQVDEGVRLNASLESLNELKPCFKKDGLVTAGTSSQLSDGAAMLVLMNKKKADELGIEAIAELIDFAVVGVDPRVMGIGPINAISKVMNRTGLTNEDMDVIELNEAFAAQAIPCIRDLGLHIEKVNPNGGAIAMGHPLGATGAILTCKALSELERINGNYALVSMCIGGGMGAAGIFKNYKKSMSSIEI